MSFPAMSYFDVVRKYILDLKCPDFPHPGTRGCSQEVQDEMGVIAPECRGSKELFGLNRGKNSTLDNYRFDRFHE